MTKRINIRHILIALVIFGMLFLYSIYADAHCDTLNGPVVESARHALAASDITPLLKWVSMPSHLILIIIGVVPMVIASALTYLRIRKT